MQIVLLYSINCWTVLVVVLGRNDLVHYHPPYYMSGETLSLTDIAYLRLFIGEAKNELRRRKYSKVDKVTRIRAAPTNENVPPTISRTHSNVQDTTATSR